MKLLQFCHGRFLIKETRSSFPIRLSEYELNALIEGAVVKHAKCSEETGKTDFEAMLSEMTNKTKMIWICNPNNPTGALNPVEEIDAFWPKFQETLSS